MLKVKVVTRTEELLASHIYLYPEGLLLLAEALADGPPAQTLEVGYWGSAGGAIAFGLAMDHFDRRDRAHTETRELQVADLLLIANDAAIPFAVSGIKGVRLLGHSTLRTSGPHFSLNEAVPRNDKRSWLGSRQPTFAGVSVRREDKARQELENHSCVWTHPSWMDVVRFTDEGEIFNVNKSEIADVKFVEVV